jgi:hypothetical protein
MKLAQLIAEKKGLTAALLALEDLDGTEGYSADNLYEFLEWKDAQRCQERIPSIWD